MTRTKHAPRMGFLNETEIFRLDGHGKLLPKNLPKKDKNQRLKTHSLWELLYLKNSARDLREILTHHESNFVANDT